MWCSWVRSRARRQILRTSLNILGIIYFVLPQETQWLKTLMNHFTTNKVPVLLTSNKGKLNKMETYFNHLLMRMLFSPLLCFSQDIRFFLTLQSVCKMCYYHFGAYKRRVWQGQAHFIQDTGPMLVLHSLQVTGDR